MTAIQIDHLRKQFGETTVISDLNLSIRSGELLVLVGPSGCGKSTVLRMIAGLEAISGGTISIGGRVVNEVLPKDRDVAMVFQSYALYPHMTVSDNIGFGLKIRKIPKATIQEKVEGIAKTLGLSDYLTRKPKALSGGQRQRVALGRAITRQPKVFLFDEPLSNLDAELRVQMRAEIGRLHKQLNTTSVYVTHDQIEAMTMGHRIAVMQKGNLLQVGAPLSLYDHPESIFVARFIGTPPMNFIQAEINSDGTRLMANGFDLPLAGPVAAVARAHRGKAVVLGFRPDSITESGPDQNGHHAPIRGQVAMVEPLGDEVIVHMNVKDAPVVAKLGSRNIPTLDEEISLALDCRRLHLFDPRSEQRLSA